VIIMEKIKTSISLDKDIYEKVKTIGDEEDRSFSQQVNKILKDFLKDKEN
jgi:predicted CopG family antitoxin